MQADDLEIPLTLMKTFPQTCNIEDLLNVAHKYTFSKSLVDQYELEYYKTPDVEILKICKLL